MEGILSPPATINLISNVLEKNGSCCRIHPKRFFFFCFLGVIKRCFPWLMMPCLGMGSQYCFSCRQLRLITMLLKFERQFSGRLRIAGTNYRPSRAALIGVWGQQAEGQAAVPGACSPNLPAVLVEANAWLFQGTGCFFIKRYVVCVCTYTYTNVSMPIYMYVYVFVCWDVYVYILECVYVYKCEYIYMYWVYIHVYMFVCWATCVLICCRVYVYICLYMSSRFLITFQ